MSQLAADIDVPASDIDDGRTYRAVPRPGAVRLPAHRRAPRLARATRRLRAAAYDGDWFWIDNRDLATKRVFSFVMLLLSLSESSKPGQPPVITIPAG